jgi:tRNA nucleotidyltransferase/poly(A) polymerase
METWTLFSIRDWRKTMKLYKVGGCVRDEIMSRQPKDIDFTIVLDNEEVDGGEFKGRGPFEVMLWLLDAHGFQVFTKSEEFLTARAKAPKGAEFGGKTLNGTFDFVLARKESSESDGRHPDKVEPGQLTDDLARRDFTMNAMAKDSDGQIIDLYNGREHIKFREIVAVGNPYERIKEDRLRALRAARFSVTLGFTIDFRLEKAIKQLEKKDFESVSVERIREELEKMMASNSGLAMEVLTQLKLHWKIFDRGLWLLPTLREAK